MHLVSSAAQLNLEKSDPSKFNYLQSHIASDGIMPCNPSKKESSADQNLVSRRPTAEEINLVLLLK